MGGVKPDQRCGRSGNTVVTQYPAVPMRPVRLLTQSMATGVTLAVRLTAVFGLESARPARVRRT